MRNRYDPCFLVCTDRADAAYLCSYIAKFTGGNSFKPRDNHDPRTFMEGLQGKAKRAHAAQLNSFEILPAFSAAVIIAHIAGGAQQGTLDALAVAFVVSRLVYIYCYLADLATLRSAVWFVGLVLIISFFVVAV